MAGAHSLVAGQPRLHIISITGLDNINKAIGMQRVLKKRMHRKDSIANICEPGCSDLAGERLDNLAEMDDDVFPVGHRPNTSYDRAQVRYAWGLVQEVKRLVKKGGPLPAWFLLKDDDTYVNANRLVQNLGSKVDPEGLYSFGTTFTRDSEMGGGEQLSGGAGWLLSRGLARTLALNYGDELIPLLAKACLARVCAWDGGCRGDTRGLPWYTLARVNGSHLMNSTEFAPEGPCRGAAVWHAKGCMDLPHFETEEAFERCVTRPGACDPEPRMTNLLTAGASVNSSANMSSDNSSSNGSL